MKVLREIKNPWKRNRCARIVVHEAALFGTTVVLQEKRRFLPGWDARDSVSIMFCKFDEGMTVKEKIESADHYLVSEAIRRHIAREELKEFYSS